VLKNAKHALSNLPIYHSIGCAVNSAFIKSPVEGIVGTLSVILTVAKKLNADLVANTSFLTSAIVDGIILVPTVGALKETVVEPPFNARKAFSLL